MGQRSTNSDRGRSRITAGRDARNERWVDVFWLAPGEPDPWPGVPGPSRGTSLAVDFIETADGVEDVQVLAVSGELAVRLPLVDEDGGGGGVRVQAVEVQRRDGAPLGAADLSRLGLGAVHREMRSLLSADLAVELLGERWGAVRLPHPGRRGRGDLFYAKAALAYTQALAVEPERPVSHLVKTARAANVLVTEDEIRARVRRARERDLLTEAPPGRAGGKLTQKAINVLRDAGLEEKEV